METMLDMAKNLTRLEKDAEILTEEAHDERLHFGLVQVVYEWANGMVRNRPNSEKLSFQQSIACIALTSVHI